MQVLIAGAMDDRNSLLTRANQQRQEVSEPRAAKGTLAWRPRLGGTYLLGIAALTVAVIIWGASFPIIQAGIGKMPVNLFLFFRFSTGAVLIVGITAIHGFRRKAWLQPGAWILGGLLYLSFVTQTEGLVLTSPARSAFLTSLSVIMVPAILCVITRKMVPVRIWFAVGVFVIGLLIFFSHAIRGSISKGDVLSVLCALCFSVYFLLAQRIVRAQDVLNVTAVQTCTVALIAGVVTLIQGSAHSISLSTETFLTILFSGVFATVLAFGAQLFAQTRIDAASTALILSLEPVVAAILSVIIGRDAASWSLLVGGGVMFAGAVIGQINSPQDD